MFHGVRLARERGLPPIANIVFMGQGEAGRNAHEVVAAAHALTDQARWGLSRYDLSPQPNPHTASRTTSLSNPHTNPRYKVTVSTVGVDAESFHTLASSPAMLVSPGRLSVVISDYHP